MTLRKSLGYLLLGVMLATPVVYSAPQGGPHKKGQRKGGKKGGKSGGNKQQGRKKGGGGE